MPGPDAAAPTGAQHERSPFTNDGCGSHAIDMTPDPSMPDGFRTSDPNPLFNDPSQVAESVPIAPVPLPRRNDNLHIGAGDATLAHRSTKDLDVLRSTKDLDGSKKDLENVTVPGQKKDEMVRTMQPCVKRCAAVLHSVPVRHQVSARDCSRH